jgi:hypothetical protein
MWILGFLIFKFIYLFFYTFIHIIWVILRHRHDITEILLKVALNTINIILQQLYQLPSCVNMKGKFVANVSFDTVRLINHPLYRIKCLASCFIKHIFFSTSLTPVWWKYLSLLSQYLKHILSYLFSNIIHKIDMNINV